MRKHYPLFYKIHNDTIKKEVTKVRVKNEVKKMKKEKLVWK